MNDRQTDADRAVAEIEGRKPEAPASGAETMPAAGPHAKEDLTRHDSAPGAGSLPDASPEVDGGAG